MKPPEKPQMDPYFIDRHNYVKTFLHLVCERDIIQFVGDTYSRYGTGKTTVLSTLYYQIEATFPDIKPLWLSLDQVSVHYHYPQLAESQNPYRDELISVQNVIDYKTVLLELAKESFPYVTNFPSILDASSFGVFREYFGVERDLNISAADAWKQIMADVQAGHITRRRLETALEAEVERLTNEFLNTFNPGIRSGQRVILFADDFCWISDQPIGNWVLNKLSGRMQNTWMIISRTTELLDVQQKSRQIENLYLTNFTPEEVASYLHKRLGQGPFPPMMVENIYHFSKGHPQTVSMVADLLETNSGTQPLNFPRWEKGEYEETIPGLLLQLIDDIEDTRDAWLSEALWLGIVARRFDADLLYRLLWATKAYRPALVAGLQHEEDVEEKLILSKPSDAEDDSDDEEEEHPLAPEIKDRILNAVTRFSFVEQHRDDQGIYYAFHNNMRDVVTQYLQSQEELQPDLFERYMALHEQLADAYSEILGGYEEQDPTERYVALYRYEDPAWQRTVSEWLYHVSQIRDRQEAELEFLNVYFTAFQWWEYYLPFPFCEHILSHWGWIQGTDERSPIYDLVMHFHEIFPRGFSKDVKEDPRWEEVQTVLEQIADAFNLLSGDPDELPAKQRALRIALTEMYIWGLRFSHQPDYDEAERLYRESIRIAQEDRDEYNESYQTAYLADMLLEMGRYDEAYTEAAAVNDLLDGEGPFDKEKDYEVLTLSYRVMGDASLFQGRYEEVAPFYIRASMCGYAQNYIMMHPPDPYTVKWYEDNMRLMARYLIEADAASEVEPICQMIHAVWDTFWQANGCAHKNDDVVRLLKQRDSDGLRDYLAPPAPDLNRSETSSAEALQEEHNRIAALFGISE